MMPRMTSESFWPLWFVDWIIRPHTLVQGALAKPERWIIAFGAVLASGLALHIYYYATVDYAWLQSSTISNAQAALTEAQEATVRRFMNPDTFVLLGGASLVVQHVFILIMLAGYFKLVSIAALARVSFLPLLALASWVRVPLIFDDMAAAWRWSQTTSHALPFNALTPLSADRLFPALEATTLSGVSIMWLWVLVLMATGLRYLMGMAWPVSVVATCLPFGILFALNQLIISLV